MNGAVFQRPPYVQTEDGPENIIYIPVFSRPEDFAQLRNKLENLREQERLIRESCMAVRQERENIIRTPPSSMNSRSTNQPEFSLDRSIRATTIPFPNRKQDSGRQTPYGDPNTTTSPSPNSELSHNPFHTKYVHSHHQIDLSYSDDGETLRKDHFDFGPHLKQLADMVASWPTTHKIPCHFLDHPQSDELIVFFHANAEDITKVSLLCNQLREVLHKNVLTMEYCGYSCYNTKARRVKPKVIRADAEYLVTFLTGTMGIPLSKITVMGRSLGGGPALHLASLFEFKMAVAVSPFISIRRVVKDRYGCLGCFVGKYFDNEASVQKARCPVLFIHGKIDDIISCYHSERLFNKTPSTKKLVLHEDMTHNKFKLRECICVPFKNYEAELYGDPLPTPPEPLNFLRPLFKRL